MKHDSPNARKGRGKKPYHKPEVKKVTLTPTEAVLGGCKASAGSGTSANLGLATCSLCATFYSSS